MKYLRQTQILSATHLRQSPGATFLVYFLPTADLHFFHSIFDLSQRTKEREKFISFAFYRALISNSSPIH
jgi:hypothetical protein